METETCPECDGEDFYLTSYCNFRHCVSCGEGLDHEECWSPAAALEAERDGDLERAIEIIQGDRQPG